MIVFIDCEWNGYRGSLLSMALVAENGQQWYREFGCVIMADPWVKEHVLPKLSGKTHTIDQIQVSLQKFLDQYTFIHLVADWPEDIERFCHLLIRGPGQRLQFPRLTMEIWPEDSLSANPHHALADATALRKAYLERRR